MDQSETHASIDPVTGGMGRLQFSKQARQLLESDRTAFAIISIDIRQFKLINVSFGRSVGNVILDHIYRCIKQSLSEEELLVRDAGDVFYVLMKTRNRQEILNRLIFIRQKVDEKIITHALVGPHLVLRFGIYLPENDKTNFERMFEFANMARKHSDDVVGCNESCFFDPNRAAKTLEEREIFTQLVTSLKEGAFEVYLQPKVSMRDGRIVGAEALARWIHPKRGLLAPGHFIATLEKYRLIHRLDMFIFEAVCQMIAKWHEENHRVCPISVNLSRQTITIPGLLEHLRSVCTRYGVSPEEIELEITETDVIRDFASTKEFLRELRKIGFRSSVDDFGIGYSSLVCLKELIVDAAKLDRSFFLGSGERACIVLSAITTLLTKLGLQVVAEGVETQEQLDFLKTTTCDLIQGYVCFKPMPVSEFVQKAFIEDIICAL